MSLDLRTRKLYFWPISLGNSLSDTYFSQLPKNSQSDQSHPYTAFAYLVVLDSTLQGTWPTSLPWLYKPDPSKLENFTFPHTCKIDIFQVFGAPEGIGGELREETVVFFTISAPSEFLNVIRLIFILYASVVSQFSSFMSSNDLFRD